MSGICAVWHKGGAPEIGPTLSAVTDGLATSRTGRACNATAAAAGVGVHARFDRTQQLFRSSHLLLACDVELINEQELRRELGSGAEPGSAALLASLYERYGDDFVSHLRGAFAVVLFDTRDRRVLAAIDGFGIKRLAWYDDGQMFVAASRLNAIRAAAGELEVNPRAIANVMNFGANLAPETIFRGVHRMRPGTRVVVSERDTRLEQFWDLQYGIDTGASEAELARQLESVVGRSVAAHYGSANDQQVGAFLSGGTDSSTVVGLMARAAAAPVKAFSIGFEEQPFNELEYARTAARAFGAEHHTYLVSAHDCLQSLPDVIRSFDEPFGNASAIPTYFCARLAAEKGVDVLLAGDGGDELFGGNERYATEQIFGIYHAIPRWLRRGLIEPILEAPLDVTLLRKGRGYVRRAKLRGVERMYSFAFLRAHTLAEVFTVDFLHELGSYDILEIPSAHYARAAATDHLDHLLYVDMKVTLADSDLPKVTCVSELAGVQARFPFLDREVVEFSGRIPARLKVKRLEKRYLFKRAFRNLLPAAIIRKKKHGFGIPVSTWIQSDRRIRELTRDTLLSSRACGRAYFRPEFIDELFQRHDATGATYYGDALWTLLMVELWLEQFVDQPAPVTA